MMIRFSVKRLIANSADARNKSYDVIESDQQQV